MISPFKDKNNIEMAVQMRRENASFADIARRFGVSRKTAVKYVRHLVQQGSYINKHTRTQEKRLTQPWYKNPRFKNKPFTLDDYFTTETGEKVNKGHNYAHYLEQAGLHKPVDNR